MVKPIKVLCINPPLKESNVSPETFAKFLLIPQFKSLEKIWPDYNIMIEIHLDDTSVDESFFSNIDAVVKREYPILLSRYTVLRK